MRLFEQFLNYITYEKRYSAHTVRAYKDDLSSFFVFSDLNTDKALVGVEGKDIRYWILNMANNGIAPRSYKRKLSSVKSFYKFLQQEGIVSHNPTDKVIVPKVTSPLPEFLNEQETLSLFEHLIFPDNFQGTRDRLVLSLFYNTGMRLSELVNLQIKDVDFSLKQISVVGKRNKQRNVPVTDALLDEIATYLKCAREEMGVGGNRHLILTNKGGEPYARFVQRIVQKYLSQVTTSEKTNPHKLRHTFATHILNKGADLNAVKELLGHANLTATEVYTHNTYEKLKSVYKQAHPRA